MIFFATNFVRRDKTSERQGQIGQEATEEIAWVSCAEPFADKAEKEWHGLCGKSCRNNCG